MVGADGIDPAWLARVEQALAPLGVTGLEVSAASLEAAFLALTAESSAESTELIGASPMSATASTAARTAAADVRPRRGRRC